MTFPAGVNPTTQLHQREMVLPEKYADVIRGLDGRAAGAAGASIRAKRRQHAGRLLHGSK